MLCYATLCHLSLLPSLLVQRLLHFFHFPLQGVLLPLFLFGCPLLCSSINMSNCSRICSVTVWMCFLIVTFFVLFSNGIFEFMCKGVMLLGEVVQSNKIRANKIINVYFNAPPLSLIKQPRNLWKHNTVCNCIWRIRLCVWEAQKLHTFSDTAA